MDELPNSLARWMNPIRSTLASEHTPIIFLTAGDICRCELEESYALTDAALSFVSIAGVAQWTF
jgi:hypothetical protein